MEWESISKMEDDFKAVEGDYMLRAEQMDDDIWWFEVYYKGFPLINHFNGTAPDTEEQAKALAEMVYNAHKMTFTPPRFREIKQ